MAGCQVGLVRSDIGIAASQTARLHRLYLRIPVEQHLVFLEIVGTPYHPRDSAARRSGRARVFEMRYRTRC